MRSMPDPQTHLGYCKECGRSVFGPASHPLRGSFAAWEVRCACLNEHIGPAITAWDEIRIHDEQLVCKRQNILGKEVLTFTAKRGPLARYAGHLEV